MDKLRCINDKSGEVKYLSSSVARNAQFMSKYGWRIEEVEKPKPIQTTPVQEPEFDASAMNFFEEEEPVKAMPPKRVNKKKGGNV
jgi:hypothetical protein